MNRRIAFALILALLAQSFAPGAALALRPEAAALQTLLICTGDGIRQIVLAPGGEEPPPQVTHSCPCGMPCASCGLPSCDRTAVPTLVSGPDVFPLWAGAFLIVAIVAAAMSSMDSVLLVAASTLYKNLIAPFGTGRYQLGWTRVAVIGFAVVAAVLALRPPGDIVEITIFSGSLYAVCFFPAVVLGLHWQRGTATAVLASMAVGVGVLLLWIVLGLRGVLHAVFPALLASIAVDCGVSMASAPQLNAAAGDG